MRFFDYVFSDDFTKEGIIVVINNPKYQKMFEYILKEPFIDYPEEIEQESESHEKTEKKIKKILIVYLLEKNFQIL